ncbi:MAG: hypothetical protein VX563_06340, partial [Planctomycetota bacterium]|nr:hypothetical protein [Planctomycetota bacterium]
MKTAELSSNVQSSNTAELAATVSRAPPSLPEFPMKRHARTVGAPYPRLRPPPVPSAWFSRKRHPDTVASPKRPTPAP